MNDPIYTLKLVAIVGIPVIIGALWAIANQLSGIRHQLSEINWTLDKWRNADSYVKK